MVEIFVIKHRLKKKKNNLKNNKTRVHSKIQLQHFWIVVMVSYTTV